MPIEDGIIIPNWYCPIHGKQEYVFVNRTEKTWSTYTYRGDDKELQDIENIDAADEVEWLTSEGPLCRECNRECIWEGEPLAKKRQSNRTKNKVPNVRKKN